MTHKVVEILVGQFSTTSIINGFETIEEAEDFLAERCATLMGYSPSGEVFTKDGIILVKLHIFNSCD